MKKYTPTLEMRTSSLSKKEGGETIIIIFDGYIVEYNNIKDPARYMATVLKSNGIIGYILGNKTIIL